MRLFNLLSLFLLLFSPPLVMAQGSGYDMDWVTFGNTYPNPIYQQVPREWGVIDIATDFEARTNRQNTYVVGSFIHHLVWNDFNLFMDQAGFGTSVGCGNRLYSSNIHGCPFFSASGFLSSFDNTGNNFSSIQFYSSNNGHTVVKGVCVDRTNQNIYVGGYFDEGLNITLPGNCNNRTGSSPPPGCGINNQYVGPAIFNGGGVFLAKFDPNLTLQDVKFLKSDQNFHIDVNGIRYNPTVDIVYVVGSFVNELQVLDSSGSNRGFPLPSVGSSPGNVDGYVIGFDYKTLVPVVGNVVSSASTDDFSESITAIDIIPNHNPSLPSEIVIGGFHTDAPIVQEPLDMISGLGLVSGSPSPTLNTYNVNFPNPAGNDLFVAKLDDKTNFIWMNVIQSGPNRGHEIHRIAADADGTNELITITGQLLPNTAGATINFYTTAIDSPFSGTAGTTATSMTFGCTANVAESFVFAYDGNGVPVNHNIHTTCEVVVIPGNFTNVHGSIGLGVDVELNNGTATPNPLTLNCGIYDGRSIVPARNFPPNISNSMIDAYDPIGFMSRYQTFGFTFSNARSFPVTIDSATLYTNPYGLTAVQYPKESGNPNNANSFSKVNGFTRMGGFVSSETFTFDNANNNVNTTTVTVNNAPSGGINNEITCVDFSLFIGAFGITGGMGNAENLKQSSNYSERKFQFVNSTDIAGILSQDKINEFRVYDLNGREVKTEHLITQSGTFFQKHQLIAGIYVLRFSLNGISHAEKFEVIK